MGAPVADGLVGRDLELKLVRGMVREVRAGQAAVLLIEGEAGIGKSRLVQSLIGEAYAAGAVVFRGEAHPFERTHPFGVVADALDLRPRSPDPRRAMIGSFRCRGRGCILGAARFVPRGRHPSAALSAGGDARPAADRGRPG